MARHGRTLVHGLRLGYVDVVRDWRTLERDRVRLALLAGAGLFGTLYFGVMALVVQGRTAELAARADPSLPPVVGLLVTLLWLSSTAVFGQRAAVRTIDIDAPSLVLTSVRPRAVTIGVLSAEFLRGLAFVALPVGVLGVGFATGAGTSVPILTVPLATVLFLTSSVCSGSAIGAVVAVWSRRARWKTGYVAGGLALLGALVVAGVMARLSTTPELAAGLPTSWYGDLFAVGTPIAASQARAFGAVLGTVAIGYAGGSVTERFATRLWLDEVESNRSARETAAAGERPRPFPRLRGRIDRPTRYVAWRSIQRVKRDPTRISHLGLPLLVGAWLLADLARSTAGRSLLPIAVGLLGSWFVGGFLTLNPLGDDGASLPATVTSPVDGSQFVRGTALPSGIVGVPLLVAAGSAISIATSALPLALGLGLWVGVHGAAAIGIALAVGMRFPRFGAIRVSRRRTVVPPSLSAIVIYSTTVLSLGLVGIGALIGPQLLLRDGAAATIAQGVSVLVWLSLEGGLGYGCYQVAVRRFDRYTLE
uniref:Transmembrane protein n=1 Tax=Halobacterium sp. (strain AS7092) TaxID=245739 RepID=Q45FP0_HALAS|nr:transmembrane protein [Halobacterium sp. AS7092]